MSQPSLSLVTGAPLELFRRGGYMGVTENIVVAH